MAPSVNGITAVIHGSPPPQPSISLEHPQPSTLAVHGDDSLNRTTDVSPALHVSTTFRYTSDPTELIPASDLAVSLHSWCSLSASLRDSFARNGLALLTFSAGTAPCGCPCILSSYSPFDDPAGNASHFATSCPMSDLR